jgi:acetyltransferase
MSTYRLDKLFKPRSIALIGASTRERSLGRTVLKNLREDGFAGAIHVVNPKYKVIDGLSTVPSLGVLIAPPDLIVVTAPPDTVPGIVSEAALKGCAAAVIITTGLGHGPGSLADQCLKASRPHGLRIVGPNGLGVLAPPAGVNASFAARSPKPGDLALISQSGAVAAGLIEWSVKRLIGFSGIVSLGDAIDVDFGDLLDFFALDSATRAILLYVEAITAPAKFLSAARAAARVKPVIVIKAGRQAQGAKAAATHTGALAGSDAVYDAVFRRAGLLRVMDLEEMFVAAETLGHASMFPGKRLAILTNGGGVGVLAVDELVELGGQASVLSSETLAKLDSFLPPSWSKSNPVDIVGDADHQRYAWTLEILLADGNSDAVLVLNVPTALASPPDAARAIVDIILRERAINKPGKPVFAGWIAEDAAAADAFQAAGVPHYATETDAVQGFMHLVRYREARDALIETPESLPEDFDWDVAAARRVVAEAVAQGRRWLDPIETSELLRAYRIPSAEVVLVHDSDEAFIAAQTLLKNHSSLVAKILSPDIVHKSDVGGVRLNLSTPADARTSTAEIIASARKARPTARVTGVTLHPMIVRSHARELIAGVADDPTFGPIIVFGHGGTAVEVIDDKALAVPPVDVKAARALIARTRISRVLAGYRNVPAADLHAIALVLVKLAQLAADLPEMRELDLNPLLADSEGVIVLDARVAVAPFTSSEQRSHGSRLAIRPYPSGWQRDVALPDGMSVIIRPIRPEDEALVRAFFPKISDKDLRLRFFATVRELSHAFISRLTQLDYSRAIAFIAIARETREMLGAVHLHADANYDIGEFAILVRSDLKGRGLGWMLMQIMLEYARSEGLSVVAGQVLHDNHTMLKMCEELGFEIEHIEDTGDLVSVRLPLGSKSQVIVEH